MGHEGWDTLHEISLAKLQFICCLCVECGLNWTKNHGVCLLVLDIPALPCHVTVIVLYLALVINGGGAVVGTAAGIEPPPPCLLHKYIAIYRVSHMVGDHTLLTLSSPRYSPIVLLVFYRGVQSTTISTCFGQSKQFGLKVLEFFALPFSSRIRFCGPL